MLVDGHQALAFRGVDRLVDQGPGAESGGPRPRGHARQGVAEDIDGAGLPTDGRFPARSDREQAGQDQAAGWAHVLGGAVVDDPSLKR